MKSSIQPQNGIDNTRFVPLDAPAPMTHAKLLDCNDVHADVGAGEAAVFAVAHRQGVVQRDADEFECEAMCVLYLTADGERAVERWYHEVAPDEFERVDRAFVAPLDDLMPIGPNARRFAPIVRRHPEVDGE